MGRRWMRMPFAGARGAARASASAGTSVSAAVGAVALGAAVVLGGCQSEETPPTASPTPSGTASSSSPSASGSTSPSPTASSDVPAAAREKTEKGAEAFVSYFFDQSESALGPRPTPGLIESLQTPDASSCRSLAKTAADLEAKGQRYVTPRSRSTAVRRSLGTAAARTLLATSSSTQWTWLTQAAMSSHRRSRDLERNLSLYCEEAAVAALGESHSGGAVLRRVGSARNLRHGR